MKSEGKIEATAIRIMNQPALGRPSDCHIPLAPDWPVRPHFGGGAHA